MRKQDSMVTEAADAIREIDQLKSKQFIGNKALIQYNTYSSNLYDYDFVITEPAYLRYFKITFTHSKAEAALLTLNVYARADNSDVMADPIPPKTGFAPALAVYIKKYMPLVPGETSWNIQVFKGQAGIPSYHAYFKFFIAGTASGTWSVTAL